MANLSRIPVKFDEIRPKYEYKSEKNLYDEFIPAARGGGDVGVVPPDTEVALAVAEVAAAGPRPAALDPGPTLVQRDGHVVAGVDVPDLDRGNARADLRWLFLGEITIAT